MDERPYGGFIRRLAAFAIDQVLLALFYTVIFIACVTILGIDMRYLLHIRSWHGQNDALPLVLSYYGMTTILNMTYFTYFHGTTGQTPGKKLLGLKVVQSDGTPVTPGIAFLRWVGYFVSAIFLYIGYLWVIVDRKKQAWHDKIAGTVVLRTRKESPLPEVKEEEKIP